MQRIKDYKIWSNLSEEEKQAEILNWNVYLGEGKDILHASIKELYGKYKSNNGIIKITNGIYHGGIWVICITIKRGRKIKIPSEYNGFLIMKSYE